MLEMALGNKNQAKITSTTKILLKVAFLGGILNLVLAISKYFLGKYVGSLSLQADALHSLTDVIGSISVFLGLKFSSYKTKTFPYGLYKLENLVSLISAGFIFFAAYEILLNAIHSESYLKIHNIPLGIVGLGLIIIALFLFSRWELKIAKKLGSPSLAADAEHMKTDFLSTAFIMGGLIGGLFKIHWLDKIAALVISIIIFRTGLEIILDSVKVLLDISLDPKIITRISEIVHQFPEVLEIKNIIGRRSGRYIFIEIEVILDVYTLEEAHEVVSMIEEEIYDNFPEIDRVIIHFEPPQLDEIKIAVPLDENEEITTHLGCAPKFLFLVINCKQKPPQIIKKIIEPNPYRLEQKRRGILLAEWLKEQSVNVLIVPKVENKAPGLFYALNSLNIKVLFCPNVKLNEILKNPPCPEH